MYSKFLIVVCAAIVAACGSVSPQVAVDTTGRPASASQRSRPSFAQFRERLRAYAEKDYPDYLDGVNAVTCAAYYPPNPRALPECRELLIGYTPVVFKYMCLQQALKTIVAGELCRAPEQVLADAAYVAAAYAHLIAETVAPMPLRPHPGFHQLTAVEVARRYLSAHHARAYGMIAFNTMHIQYEQLLCNGDLAQARDVSGLMIKFAFEYLGAPEIEHASKLARRTTCSQ
jgi:hypothetical protein